MAQPTPYVPDYDFSNFQSTNPSDPLPGDRVDVELANLQITTDQVLANLVRIQRDDGALANQSVGIDQLKPEVDFGFNTLADWVTGIAYVVRDGVYQGNKVYRCIISHTSDTFSTDLAAGRWVEIADYDQFISAAAASAAAAAVSEAAAAVSAISTAADVVTTNADVVSAAASAAAAASSAAEGLYNNVVTITSADSPYVPLLADEGTLYRVDTTAGAVVVNLSALSVYAEDMKYAFIWVAGGNTTTINRGGSDTFNNALTTFVLDSTYLLTDFVGDLSSANWAIASSVASILSANNTWTGLNVFSQNVSIATGASVSQLTLDGATHDAKFATDGGGSILSTTSGGYLILGTNDTERMRISASGDAIFSNSITAEANAPTGYAATFRADGDLATDYAAMQFTSNTGGASLGSIWTAANIGGLVFSGANAVSIRTGNAGVTGGTDRITVDVNGLVGLNTSASYDLHVHAAPGSPTDTGLFLTNTTTGAAGSDGFGLYISGLDARVQNQEAGSLSFWTSNASRMSIQTAGTILQQCSGATIGVNNVEFADATRACVNIFQGADGTGYSGVQTILGVRQATTTGRSINASGTINASGADYAEYETKCKDCAEVSKGAIVGFDKEGLITDIFDDAISFAVKSTNPNLVGGDAWGLDLGDRPQPPDAISDKASEEDKKSHIKAALKYKNDSEEYDKALDKKRAVVDRIAYCGKTPVNVIGAEVGEYIIPINVAGSIVGKPMRDVTFDEYRRSVGRVKRILDDGRAEITVSIT